MVSIILQSLYYFLPAYGAKIISSLPLWEKKHLHHFVKIDWRDLLLTLAAGTLLFLLQKYIYVHDMLRNLALIDYAGFTFVLGLLMALGVIIGDALRLYFKEKNDIPSNQHWILADQWGYVLGAGIFSSILYVPDVMVVVILFIASPIFQFAWYYIHDKISV